MSTDAKTIGTVAARLREAAETGVAIPPIRDELAGAGVADAYASRSSRSSTRATTGFAVGPF